MLLTVIKNSKVKVYDQIFKQITALINNGTIGAGTRLPSTRELAKTIGVNRSTVIRVYEELGAQGYIESAPGSYTTVRKKRPIILMHDKEVRNHQLEHDIYKDNHDLNYDKMMYYLENGKSMGNGEN